MPNNLDGTTERQQNILSSPAAAGAGLPTPDVARFALWESGGNSGTTLPDFSGFTVVTNDVGTFISLAGAESFTGNPPTATEGMSQTVSNADALEFYGAPFALPENSIDFKSTIKLGSAGKFYVGMSSLAPGLTSLTDPTTVDSMLLGSNGVNPNFVLITTIGGVAHTVDTGIVIDNKRHVIEIKYTPGATPQVQAYIDGALVATSLTDLPVAALGVMWYLPATPTGATTSDFEYMFAETPTP